MNGHKYHCIKKYTIAKLAILSFLRAAKGAWKPLERENLLQLPKTYAHSAWRAP